MITSDRVWTILNTLNDALEGFKPSDLKYLQSEMNEILKGVQDYENRNKQIAELQEDIKNKSSVIIDLTNKVSRRNLQIADLKKHIAEIEAIYHRNFNR